MVAIVLLGLFDWFDEFWEWLKQIFVDGFSWLGDRLSWLVDAIMDGLLTLIVKIATYVINLLPAASTAEFPEVPTIPQAIIDTFQVINLFFDMKYVIGVLLVIFSIEGVFLLIHGVLWIKRFIPTMGH